jgi:Skp family chaperone for outer membrane proteins
MTKENVVSDWVSFLTIFSTLLAAFFIYSSWKIDSDLKKIDKEYEKVNSDLKDKIYHLEIDNEMNQMITDANILVVKEKFEDALDTLDDLLRKDFVELDNRRRYRVYKEISAVHYAFGEWGDKNHI